MFLGRPPGAWARPDWTGRASDDTSHTVLSYGQSPCPPAELAPWAPSLTACAPCHRLLEKRGTSPTSACCSPWADPCCHPERPHVVQGRRLSLQPLGQHSGQKTRRSRRGEPRWPRRRLPSGAFLCSRVKLTSRTEVCRGHRNRLPRQRAENRGPEPCWPGCPKTTPARGPLAPWASAPCDGSVEAARRRGPGRCRSVAVPAGRTWPLCCSLN